MRKLGHRGLVVCIAVALFCCGAGVAYAFLTGYAGRAVNTFTAGAVSVQVVERDAQGALITDPTHVSYGSSSKNVTLKVPDGYSRAVLRARIVPPQVTTTVGGREVNVAYDMGTGAIAQPDADGLVYAGGYVLHFASDWASHWFWKDGYFYYRSTRSAGEETAKLLTGVTLADGFVPAGAVKVTVVADALQSTPPEAPAEWGVSVDETGVVGDLG